MGDQAGAGHTLVEVTATDYAFELPSATPRGGPIDPGEDIFLNVDLEPGAYAMVCFVEAPDDTPHALKGMAVELTVTG